MATGAATAAKAAGTEIFVVGVGVTPTTSAYLQDNIATDASHYFDVADYTSLSTTLQQVPICSQLGTLIVKKIVSGTDANPSTFSFQVNGGTAVAFESDCQNELSLSAGTYTVTEPVMTMAPPDFMCGTAALVMLK